MRYALGGPTTAYVPDPTSDYTKCHECGEWDGHARLCLIGLSEAYVDDLIDIREFDSRVGDALGVRP